MPQLMPLNWCISFSLVILLMLMMMFIYFEWIMSCNVYINKNFKAKFNWKW